MRKGLLKIEWDKIQQYTDEQITYFLFLEGKSYDVISKIRNIPQVIVKKQVIEGKIKYGFLAKSRNQKELLMNISKAGKLDKIDILKCLDEEKKSRLIEYIKRNYVDMYAKQKETAIWIIGELKEESCNGILVKACVHKFINVRRMAVSAMGKIGDKYFEMSLMRALEDENSQVVVYAIKALEKINSEKATSKVQHISKTSEKQYVRDRAKVYLEQVKERAENNK